MRPHSLRSGEILSLLIHRDLSTLVVFVTGISSSLRPVLLWREQALLILLAELIRPSIYPSLSLSLSLVLSVLSLAPLLWHMQHTRGVMLPWLNAIDSVNKALKTLTHSLRLSSSYTSLDNSFEIQWADSKCLWRWLSAIWSDLWYTKQDACWTAQCAVCD